MPVRDRLDELQSRRQLLGKGDKKDKSKTMNNGKEKGLNGFLHSASTIDGELAKYKSSVVELKKQQLDLVSSPFADKSAIARYEGLIQQITQHGVKIRKDIRELEDEGEKYVNSNKNDEAFKRVYKQQLNGLSTQLAMVTNDFFKCQSNYADKMKDRLKRQLYARGESEVTDERVNEILGTDSYNVFTQNFISEVQDAEETLRELEERHKDILALEKSVTDVNVLFKELNLMVSQQGETLDNIEQNIDQVEVHVEAGNVQLKQAKMSQSKARRKKFCCFGIIGVAVVILIIIIVVVATQSSG
ncbi:syntaxin-like [Littorina saxatilis]|uniref:t-SNARE coiled-coil homology domain-containing protein n=1 Tax=Littorina saxatilis TaxID=31220 RepID=A0AAN9G9M4_9CAEN